MRTGAKITAARRMRKTMTKPEVWLWVRIRGDIDGFEFRKQHPMGDYILNFYCVQAKLAVEVDGAFHTFGDRPERDAKRDLWFAEQGVYTHRIMAVNILANPDESADGVLLVARERMAELDIPLPSLAPQMPLATNAIRS